MVRRIVLGCGSIGHAVVEALCDRRGDLLVVDESENRVETLRNEGINAEHAHPADVASVAEAADIVFVGDDDPEINRDAARASRDAFPDCNLIVYAGVGAPENVLADIRAVADQVLEPERVLASSIFDRVEGGDGDRLKALKRVLRDIEGRLGVFTHDDPDPDAIGSAIALVALARARGVEAEAYYFGEIAHQENRALVNLLDLELTNLEPAEFDSGDFGAIALVDHSRPGVNDRLPEDTPVDIVVDHHPPRGPIQAEVVDVQSDVGATSTLLVSYFRGFERMPDPDVATALLYGIRVDTRDFGREITQRDFEAAAFLLSHARTDVLERVESPSLSAETMDTIARAIRNYTRDGSIVISGLGSVSNRDSIAQGADRLLAMKGVSTTVVFGVMNDMAFLSGRTRQSDLDIGETMRQAFDQIGSAGGHSDMAGAQIPLGILGSVEEQDESLEAILEEVIRTRLFEVIDRDVVPPVADVGPLGEDVDVESTRG